MSLHRRAAKRDDSEAEVINALVEGGAKVQQLSGEGVPDLLVLFLGELRVVEVKTGNGKLTKAQQDWHDAWNACGPVIVRNGPQARKLLKVWEQRRKATRIAFPPSDPITDQADGVRENEEE